ncbi:hypothetical protein V8E53_014460 [Lactarius tabidus]
MLSAYSYICVHSAGRNCRFLQLFAHYQFDYYEASNATLARASAATFLQPWLLLLESSGIGASKSRGSQVRFSISDSSVYVLHSSSRPSYLTSTIATVATIPTLSTLCPPPLLHLPLPVIICPSLAPTRAVNLLQRHRPLHIANPVLRIPVLTRPIPATRSIVSERRLAGAHVIPCTTSWPEVEQIIECVVSVISLPLHGAPLSSEALRVDARSSGVKWWVHIGTSHDPLPSRRQQHNYALAGAWPSPGAFPVSPDCQHNPFHQFRPGFRLRDTLRRAYCGNGDIGLWCAAIFSPL